MAGKLENKAYAAPINAISHWIWGDDAARHDKADLRHTLVGYGIHHASATFWAIIYEHATKSRPVGNAVQLYADAAVISALACFVDYHLTPHRLRPGYEMRLSRMSLLVVYAAFALGLARQKLSRQPAGVNRA
ncbi:hypothetical protein LG198_12130 [Methylobacillus arboreus]|uniref:hypothetical protein n=1 Tax=Methylobacillus arboreus TaxID=755170 RepID=UPI001E47EF0C|nr:hypothetical protein [Methylobacillus arboreus]MCB5191477.1 hypothetical protein [Methylobacillus arboreus]